MRIATQEIERPDLSRPLVPWSEDLRSECSAHVQGQRYGVGGSPGWGFLPAHRHVQFHKPGIVLVLPDRKAPRDEWRKSPRGLPNVKGHAHASDIVVAKGLQDPRMDSEIDLSRC